MNLDFARRILLFALAVSLSFACIARSETADLRGYGKVTANISPEHAEFICANETKADILLGKLLADLFWDAGTGHLEKTVTVEGKPIVVHLWAPYGAMIAGRLGSTVLVAGGKDEQEAITAAEKDSRFLSKEFAFKPAKPYPMLLDFYDLRAWKAESKGLYKLNHYDNDTRMQFVNEFCNGGLMGGIAFAANIAPGINRDFSVSDTDIRIAAENNQMYCASVSTGVWPMFAQHQWPQLLEVDSADSPAEAFYPDKCEAFGITPQQRYETSLGFLRDVLERYKNNNNWGGLELYCGDYGCESYFDKARQGRFGYTAAGEEAFRAWLKGQYTLAQLGERWYGDGEHFKTWSEVQLPDDLDDFFGNLNDQCLRIDQNWSWMLSGSGGNLSQLPDDSAPGWLPAGVTPSRKEYLTINKTAKPAFWKVNFDAGDWLKRNGGKDVWLVCNTNNAGSKQYQVWLNGKPLPNNTRAQFIGPSAFKLTGLLSDGENKLTLALPGGQIRGPVFLTTTEPRPYPYLGKQANARYVDMLEWQCHELNGLVIGTMKYARSIDPDRPFVIDPTNQEVKDGQGEALSQYGGSMHDTGYEASFRPLNSGLGYVGGFYGSCEPAGYIPTKEPGNWPETRMLSQMILNGVGHFRMTGDPSYFYQIEKNSGWLKANRRAMELVGKTLPEKPDVLIFASSENALLADGGRAMAEWSIGRGEIHACHFDNMYITESMLEKGWANDYPVLMDPNTPLMSAKVIDAIRKYVEQGGTFIALHQSGKDDVLEPDTWPVSTLTGFKVQKVGETGQITFGKNLPIFKGWEGKQFDGEGSAMNWKDEESAKGVSTSLVAVAPDAIPLARWADGTVAVGMRPLGKGRVIVLGSTFWREANDKGGTGVWKIQDSEETTLNKLFTDLGVRRTATASDKRIFARKMITKNGLQNWLVLLNTTGEPLTVNAGFAAEAKPAEVRDLINQTPVSFDYENGWVTIRNATVPPFGRCVFAAPRAGLAGGLNFWWGEKTKFWKSSHVKPIPAPAKMDKSNSTVIAFEKWKFLPDTDNTVSAADAWAGPAFTDGTWRTLDNTPWNYQCDDLKSYSGVGLYRSHPFALPAEWRNQRISLNIEPPWGGCYSKLELFVNGTAVSRLPRPHHKLDITDLLKSSGNVVAVKLSGTTPLSGLLNCPIWVEREITLKPEISLMGEWGADRLNSTTPEKVTLANVDPLATDQGYFFDAKHRRIEDESYLADNHMAARTYTLERDVEIPADWKGKNIFVRINSPQMNGQILPLRGLNQGMVVINNEPIAFSVGPNQTLDDETVNLTPFVKFGEKNHIEIWPGTALNGSNEECLLVINSMELGCEAK